jgi:glycerol-3-phosphate dehydrogenase subunit B
MTDLLIIGAGLTGLMAGYTAAKAGLNVHIIAKGMGATHWSAGTVDVLGYHAQLGPGPVPRPLESREALLAANPQHPYGLLSPEQLQSALDEFQRFAEQAGLSYAGADTPGANRLLPSPVGAPRPVFLAPAGQQDGDLGQSAPMLIIGFEGMRDFYPRLIAENLGKLGMTARSAWLPLSLISDSRDRNSVQLAKLLDNPIRVKRLAAAVKRLAHPGERIGLPAILGFAEHESVLNTMVEQVGLPIFEIPTLPPSVPGIRLHTALRRRLERMGVRIDTGMEALGFTAQDGVIQWVESETSARPLKHRARSFLLATGGVLGGGFNSDHTGRIWETIFDLPLAAPTKRSEWFRPRFLDPAGQPVFQAGVPVNREFQPVNTRGEPVFANLWAAGGLLAHADPLRERSLEGIAIATGTMAAQAVARRQAEARTNAI